MSAITLFCLQTRFEGLDMLALSLANPSSSIAMVSVTGAFFTGIATLTLLALMSLLRLFVRHAPMSQSRRTAMQRLRPLVDLALVTLYLLLVLPQLSDKQSSDWGFWLPVATLVLLLWVASFAVRDFFVGVMLRSAGLLNRGDEIHSGKEWATIKRMGYRTILVENLKSEQSLIPYSTFLASPLRRRSGPARSIYQFTLRRPGDASPLLWRQKVEELVSLHHIYHPSLGAHYTWENDDELRIQLHPLVPEHGPSLEEDVRNELAKQQSFGFAPPTSLRK